VITGKNFGAGSSRQQAVDCFKSLGIQIILAESFGAIYERNAINAAFPILTYANLAELQLKQRDKVKINIENGILENLTNGKKVEISKFFDVQMEIYKKNGLLK
jgi:3-isopropylmalate dehydratase small subunit